MSGPRTSSADRSEEETLYLRGLPARRTAPYLLGEQRRIVGVSGHAARSARACHERPRAAAFNSTVEKISWLPPLPSCAFLIVNCSKFHFNDPNFAGTDVVFLTH